MHAGLDVNAFGQRLSFFFNAHNDFLEEVAKFRAARRLWARIMRDRFGATNPRAQQLRFHTQTAGSTLTAQQPDNNIVRVAHPGAGRGAGRHAVAALQRHATRRSALPTEESARIALRTQQVIASESGVVQHASIRSAAPGRSRAATNRIEQDAVAMIERIDAAGGTLRGDRAGPHPARDPGVRLPRAAGHRRRRDHRRRREPVSGAGGGTGIEVLRIDPELEQQQAGARGAVRASRDQRGLARGARRDRGGGASPADNLVPPIIEAVEALRDRGRDLRCAAARVRRARGDRCLSRCCAVEHLTTGFDVGGRFVPAVIDVSFTLAQGETLCLVGESGSGKSLTAFSIMRLVQPPGRIDRGRVIVYKGRDLLPAVGTRDAARARRARSR